MPKLKNLSDNNVCAILALFGFEVFSQRGSHVKLRRILKDGTKQILTIPLHDELDKGTLKAIYRQASMYIPSEKLRPHFYTI
jgi:predicted RNA binding protein YcfA (HicA-like mRNA interferase family)